MTRILFRLTLMGAFTALMITSAGACDNFGQFCEDFIDCIDGNEADVDACIEVQEAEEERASLYGCGEWFDNRQDCYNEEARCEGQDTFTAENRCRDEERDYNSCMSD